MRDPDACYLAAEPVRRRHARGLAVRSDDGAELGQLSEVLDLPQGQVYVVKGEREILIPDVPEFILNIDPETGITVHLIEGM